jgi:hypothetical protein
LNDFDKVSVNSTVCTSGDDLGEMHIHVMPSVILLACTVAQNIYTLSFAKSLPPLQFVLNHLSMDRDFGAKNSGAEK